MMTKIWCLVVLLWLVVVSCAVADRGDPADAQGRAVEATCLALCGSSSPLSCNMPGSCQAVDQNCGAGVQGYMICNNVKTFCPACPAPPECVDGDVRDLETGSCCCVYLSPSDALSLQIRSEQICVNGHWVDNGTSCGGDSCGGVCPVISPP